MRLSSGYIFSAFESYIKKNPTVRSVLKKFCNFEAESMLIHQDYIEIDGQTAPLALLNNLIVRGFPTFSSLFLEEQSAETSDFLYQKESEFLIQFGLEDVTVDEIFGSLTASSGVTRFLREHQKLNSDSDFEASLIPLLEEEFGEWISTILCQQIPFTDLSPDAIEFSQQRVDYLIPFPEKIHDLNGFVIELDGPQHQNYGERDLDQRRENEALKKGYGTIRILSSYSLQQKKNKLRLLSKYLNADVFQFYKNRTDADSVSTELILNPLTWGRIQLCIIKAVLCNQSWLNDPILRFAILERESTNSHLAVDDLNNWMSHLTVLTENASLPIFECDTFKDESEIENQDNYHAVIDVSMQHRFSDLEFSEKPNRITIRNAPLHIQEERKILTGPHLGYKPFGTFENSKWETTDPVRIDSLTYFLRSLFRKKNFRDGQLPILNRSLQGLSVIGLLPTGGGKSLTYQISAIMQPGVCMVIDPIISLMRDQVKGLKDHWIDACYFINSTIKTREEKIRIQNRISKGEALFFFISPERLLIEDFRSYLLRMTKEREPVYFSYCVIDEAHCVSEWGHDFRTSYLSVAENGIRFCTTHPDSVESIPIFALTATASYDVLTDIQRELSGNDMSFRIGEEAIVELEDYTRPELSFKVQQIDSPDLKKETGFGLKQKVSEIKNEKLKDIILHHEHHLDKQAGLIFCPHRSHYFGVTDRFKANGESNGVLDQLYNHVQRLSHKMDFFMGSDEDSKDVQELSIKNQDDFLEGKLSLLVATKAFGMGIDKNNIRFTVHYNYPSSIESFLQEAGRAGRGLPSANCYLLYTKVEGLKEDVEFEVNSYFHSRAYRGVDKEKAVISELLHKIHEPDRTYSLTADIQDEFGVEAVVTIWTSRGNNRYVSVQESFQEKIGSIMVNGHGMPVYLSDEVNNGESNYSEEFANEILTYLKNKITPQGNGDQVWDWLNSSGGTRPGIFQVLKMPDCTHKKYSGKLELAWENNIKERIKYIQLFVKDALRRENRRFQDSYVERLVQSSIQGKGSSLNFDDLIEKINSGLSNYKFDLLEQADNRDRRIDRPVGSTIEGLKDYYNQVRDKADTEKAIYRLRLLGVIDDYTVDYRTNMFILYLSNKPNKFYEKRVKHYLSKFYSDERVNKEMEKVNKDRKSGEIERYLNYLVNFGYEQIAEKRARSIVDMKEACKFGVERESKEFAEYLNLYLNSKYFRDEYEVDGINESLPFNLDNGKITDQRYIWHYIELMTRDSNGEINNLKHLRGATLRMLRVSTDNPVLLTLAAYSTFVLEYNSKNLLQEAEQNLMSALDYYENEENWTEIELRALFDKLVSIIRSKRPEIDDHYRFEFENFRLSAIYKSLKNMNSDLSHINHQFLPYV